MSLVIADTSPVHYLILIDQISLLPALFERILIPATVRKEMLEGKTPDSIGQWITAPPTWLEVLPDPVPEGEYFAIPDLDAGERAALQLAINLKATLVLMDDRAGVMAARQSGLRVTGTLGVLDLAGGRGLVDVEAANRRTEEDELSLSAVDGRRFIRSERRAKEVAVNLWFRGDNSSECLTSLSVDGSNASGRAKAGSSGARGPSRGL